MKTFAEKFIKISIALSILFIGIQIIPISKKARIWNNCFESTFDYLESNETLKLIKAPALQWIAISICNGNGAKKNTNLN